MSVTTDAPPTPLSVAGGRSLWRNALVAALVAVAANLALWAVARGPLGVPAVFPPLQSPVATLLASIVGIVAGAVVFALMRRFLPRPTTAFRVVAAAGVLLSLGGPLSAQSEPGGSATAVAVLVLMHLVTAAVAVVVLPRGRDVA